MDQDIPYIRGSKTKLQDILSNRTTTAAPSSETAVDTIPATDAPAIVETLPQQAEEVFTGKGEGDVGKGDDPVGDVGSGSFLDAPPVTSTPIKPGQPPSEASGSLPQATMDDLFDTGKDMRSPNAKKQARDKTKNFTKNDREIAKISAQRLCRN